MDSTTIYIELIVTAMAVILLGIAVLIAILKIYKKIE